MCFPTYSTHRKWKWEKRRERGDNRAAAIAVELILCVICKLAEEIEKATGKEEQFKVVKGASN